MMYAQYCRIESRAGGVGCSARQFIKAAHTMLKPRALKFECRDARHAWLRDGLNYRLMARDEYMSVMRRGL